MCIMKIFPKLFYGLFLLNEVVLSFYAMLFRNRIVSVPLFKVQ